MPTVLHAEFRRLPAAPADNVPQRARASTTTIVARRFLFIGVAALAVWSTACHGARPGAARDFLPAPASALDTPVGVDGSTGTPATVDQSNPPPPPYPVAQGDERFMPLPYPGWHVARATQWGDSAPSDLAHGVVYPIQRYDSIRPYPRVDTIRFHASPDTSSPVVGAIVTNVRAERWGVFADAWAPESLTANWVEYGYEESGIPYDSIGADGHWHRAILGFTSSGAPWYGWAALGDSVLGREAWKDKFLDNALYFIDFYTGTFHAEPGGPVITTPMALADSGFDVTSVEARWPWLRVKVEHPGQMCDPDLPPNRRTDYYWIRAFDDRGRPLVFYPTRGC